MLYQHTGSSGVGLTNLVSKSITATKVVENGNKIKGLKQNSQQGKQLARTANHDGRVAGTAAGRTPSRYIYKKIAFNGTLFLIL